MWKVSRSPAAPSSLPFVLLFMFMMLDDMVHLEGVNWNKSCRCLLALWPGWNVNVARSQMAERLEDMEDQEKKSGSDLEFGVPDVQLDITNKIIDPFLHTYLSLSLQLHLSRWTTYLMLWRMYGAGVHWVNIYIPITHMNWMTYSDGMSLTRLALKPWLKSFSVAKEITTSIRRGGQ